MTQKSTIYFPTTVHTKCTVDSSHYLPATYVASYHSLLLLLLQPYSLTHKETKQQTYIRFLLPFTHPNVITVKTIVMLSFHCILLKTSDNILPYLPALSKNEEKTDCQKE